MTSVTTIGPAYRAALAATAKVAINDPDVRVILGPPSPADIGTGSSLDIVSVGKITSILATGPMGSQRSRYETLEAHVLFRVDRPADLSDQEVSERCLALLGAVEEYVRYTDASLGGVLEAPAYCVLTGYEWVSDSWSDDATFGRTVEIDATFVASLIRIAN